VHLIRSLRQDDGEIRYFINLVIFSEKSVQQCELITGSPWPRSRLVLVTVPAFDSDFLSLDFASRRRDDSLARMCVVNACDTFSRLALEKKSRKKCTSPLEISRIKRSYRENGAIKMTYPLWCQFILSRWWSGTFHCKYNFAEMIYLIISDEVYWYTIQTIVRMIAVRLCGAYLC